MTGISRDEDQQIIFDLKQNNADRRRSEEALFKRYAYFIREGVNKHGITQEESFDAYSDTILAAIQKISNGSFQEKSSLKTYLYQIFQNKCVDLLRKMTTNKYSVNRTESISDMLLRISDSGRSIIQKLIDKTDWAILKERLNQLNAECRQMLLLWADNYSDKEIAGTMQYKTADVVKTSRLRCMEKLRKLYKNTD